MHDTSFHFNKNYQGVDTSDNHIATNDRVKLDVSNNKYNFVTGTFTNPISFKNGDLLTLQVKINENCLDLSNNLNETLYIKLYSNFTVNTSVTYDIGPPFVEETDTYGNRFVNSQNSLSINGNVYFTGNLYKRFTTGTQNIDLDLRRTLYDKLWLSPPGINNSLYFDGGNVGIGTGDPKYLLDLVGNANISGGTIMRIPSGNTLQREKGTNGLMRFNNERNQYEAFLTTSNSETSVIGIHYRLINLIMMIIMISQ